MTEIPSSLGMIIHRDNIQICSDDHNVLAIICFSTTWIPILFLRISPSKFKVCLFVSAIAIDNSAIMFLLLYSAFFFFPFPLFLSDSRRDAHVFDLLGRMPNYYDFLSVEFKLSRCDFGFLLVFSDYILLFCKYLNILQHSLMDLLLIFESKQL